MSRDFDLRELRKKAIRIERAKAALAVSPTYEKAVELQNLERDHLHARIKTIRIVRG